MLKKRLYFLSLAAICLLLGQATAISENLTPIENNPLTFENNALIIVENSELTTTANNESIVENNESNYYESNESIPDENGSSRLFSLAPLNPYLEEYLQTEALK